MDRVDNVRLSYWTSINLFLLPMTNELENKKLFWACFIALVATSFFFGLRSVVVGQLVSEFNFSQAEIGQILGPY